MPMLRTIERPMKATLRPCSCGRVEHLLDPVHVGGEAGHDDPAACALAKIESSTGPISRSGVTKPGISALVESDSSRSTPSAPSRAKPARSVIRPSSGSWSILKSPVCSTSPAGGPDRHRERVRDRVVDREELALERPEPLPAALPHGQRVRLDAPLGQLGLDQREGELGADQRDVRLVRAAGTAPRRCGPRGRGSARSPGRRRAGPGSGAKSGRIRSTPGCSTSGKSTPQSTTSSLPSYSKTVMLRPMAPSPPSGMTRSPPSGSGGGGPSCASVARPPHLRRRHGVHRSAFGAGPLPRSRRAAGRSRRRWRRPAADRTGPAGRPRDVRPALTRIVPWVRKMPVNSGSSRRCSASAVGHVAPLVRLDHLLGAARR